MLDPLDPLAMEIRTRRLLLRPLDGSTLRNLARGRAVGPTLSGLKVPLGWPSADLLEAFPVMANDLGDDPSSLGWHAWAIALIEDHHVVGDAGFKGAPDEDGMVELGYSILPWERNKGFAREAVLALIGWARSTGKVKRVTAECGPENHASITLLRSLSLKEIGGLGAMTRWEMHLFGPDND